VKNKGVPAARGSPRGGERVTSQGEGKEDDITWGKERGI